MIDCAAHPGVAALYRCDGCRRLLCGACVEMGHRLLICRHCRERALPLDPALPASVPALRRAMARARPVSWSSTLLYPVRGRGTSLFWVNLALWLLLPILAFLPGIGLAGLYFRGAVGLLQPGFLYAIVRHTADGDDDLPDWPDIAEPGERLREVATALGILVVTLAPAVLALLVLDCDLLDMFAGAETSAACWWTLAVCLAITQPLAVPMFGALAIHQRLDLLLRPALHLRALRAAGEDGVGAVLVTYTVLTVTALCAVSLSRLPLLGDALAACAGTYGSFVAARAVGLMFRRHAGALEALYQ